jgi:hypothetical protein
VLTVALVATTPVAIVEKFMNDNPSRWHQPMAILVWLALQEACPR